MLRRVYPWCGIARPMREVRFVARLVAAVVMASEIESAIFSQYTKVELDCGEASFAALIMISRALKSRRVLPNPTIVISNLSLNSNAISLI